MAERVFLNSKDRAKMPLRPGAPYRISVGLQASHPRNRQQGVAKVDCAGACNCTCDGAGEAVAAPPALPRRHAVELVVGDDHAWQPQRRRGRAAVGAREPRRPPRDACVVRVTNAERGSAAEARAKVVVRAMIVGLNDWRTRAARQRGDREAVGGEREEGERERRAARVEWER